MRRESSSAWGQHGWRGSLGLAAVVLGGAVGSASCGGDDTETSATTTSTSVATTTTTTSGGGQGGAGGSGGVAEGGGGAGTGGIAQGGGGAGGAGGGPVVCTTTATAASHGSAIAISPDDSRIVAVNRDKGSVTVLAVDYSGAQPAMTSVAEIAVGGEPWQVVIDGCGTTAYVILRRDQKIVEIRDLLGAPIKGAELATGSEPTGIAITPNNSRVYVANWVDGTLSMFDTEPLTDAGKVDLNPTLAATGLLGMGVAARPGLTHPRSLAITNDLDADDGDEKVYVTEYFAQRIAAEAADGKNADTSRKGLVYAVKTGDDSVTTIDLAPLADTGFPDAAMQPTGCFPNQLQSITIQGAFAYVTSICASPEGPIGPKNNTHPVLSVVSLASDTELASATLNLNKKFEDLYVTNNVPDDAARRRPHIANDVSFLPASGVAYVSANGADAAFRVRFDPITSAFVEVGSPGNPNFINLAPTSIADPSLLGRGAIGIVVANTHPFAFAASDITRNVAAIDLAKQIVAGSDTNDPRVIATTAPPGTIAEQAVVNGKRFFNTALGRWSLNGQAWGSCQACHIDGLTDNVTWYFARGPRQSTSLDGSFASNDPADRRIFNWTSVFDEMHDFEGNTRGVSGGVGALVSVVSTPPVNADRIDLTSTALFPPAGAAGLNGSAEGVTTNNSVIKDWNEINEYTKTIRSPRGVTGLNPADVAAGAALFSDIAQGGLCQGCHGGPKWTISRVFYPPTNGGMPNANQALLTKSWDAIALIAQGFPAALLPATTPANQVMRFGGANPAALDQILCMLRPVGTFGIAPPDVGIAEVRADHATAAQGNAIDGKGYNPPSLLGLGTGAPYFHAGNARTLEELFSPTFGVHWKALTNNANFLLQAGDTQKLIAYLLTIDESTMPHAIPPVGDGGGDFCTQ